MNASGAARPAELLLIDNIANARHCMENGLGQGRMLVSFNPAVDVFLRKHWQVECQCLSQWISEEEQKNIMEQCYGETVKLVDGLDGGFRQAVKAALGFEVDCCRAMYSYIVYNLLCTIYSIEQGLQNLAEAAEISKIMAYDFLFENKAVMNRTLFTFRQTIGSCIGIPELEWEFLLPASTAADSGWKRYVRRMADLSMLGHNLRAVKRRLKRKLDARQHARQDSSRQTILVSEPLYDLAPVVEQLDGYNLVYYRNTLPLAENLTPSGWHLPGGAYEPVPFPGFEKPRFENRKLEFLAQVIIDDLAYHWPEYAPALKLLEHVNETTGIRAALWGNPPLSGFRALVYEMLRKQGIPVIGAQHGAIYGDSYALRHFFSDYDNCSAYFSYGFTNEDLARTYPAQDIRARVVPVGKPLPEKPGDDSRKKADIVFPMTVTASMLHGGMTQIAPHHLLDRQLAIVKHLDTLKDCSVFIKPIPGMSQDNMALRPLLEDFVHVNVIQNMSLNNFFEVYEPRVMVLETPATALLEHLHEDIEIFMIGDPVIPYEKEALQMLKRRVHYFEDAAGLIDGLNAFLEGRIEARRDSSYMNHYLRYSAPREPAANYVKEIII